MATSFSMTLGPAGHFEDPREHRYCEPYVLVTSIRLHPSRPDVEAFLYGPWGWGGPKAAAGAIPLIRPLIRREGFWQLGMLVDPPARPDEMILLVALIEHLDANPGGARALIRKAVIEELDASAGMSREARVARLIDTMNGAIDSANGGPNVTSAVGILLQTEDLEHSKTNGSRTFVRSFSGYGGDYCLRLELRRAEAHWQPAHQVDEAFAGAAE